MWKRQRQQCHSLVSVNVQVINYRFTDTKGEGGEKGEEEGEGPERGKRRDEDYLWPR